MPKFVFSVQPLTCHRNLLQETIDVIEKQNVQSRSATIAHRRSYQVRRNRRNSQFLKLTAAVQHTAATGNKQRVDVRAQVTSL